MPDWVNTGTHLRFDCGCEFALTDDPYIKELDRPSCDIDLDNIPANCWKTWYLIGTGRTKGIFQLESRLGQKWAKELKPENYEHICALGTILRPGSLHALDDEGVSVTKHYCNRKNELEPVSYDDISLKPILEKTYGLNIFQENSINIVKLIASFSAQEADTLRKCVTGDTMFVSKKRGWITIDRLLSEGYEDDLFLVMDENGKQSWQEIEKIWGTGRKDVNNVESASGFGVKATRYHQFLTSAGWKARARLADRDNLICAKYVEYDGEDKISSNLALVIAGIVAEGYFIENNNARFVNHDSDMMKLFCGAFTNEFGYPPRMSGDNKVAGIIVEYKKRINEHLVYGLSKTKKLPDLMMGMTKETTRKFLSFLLGCEGGVTIDTGYFEFSSKSKDLTDQVKLLLLRFGVRSYINLKHDKEYGVFYRLFINDKNDQKTIIEENLDELWPQYKKRDFRLRFKTNDDLSSTYTTDIIPNEVVIKLLDQYPYVMGVGACGRWRKENISRAVFRRLTEKSKDGNWINLANGHQVYEQVKSKDEWYKQQKVYDFTIKGGKTPYIIANGLVIHNSIGKKDAQIMSKVRKLFLDKAKETGIVSEEKAVKIFANIQESQRYSFNRSHSWSYGINGYESGYLKAHFQTEFYNAWLLFAKDRKPKPKIEVNELVSEAKLNDIEVKTPDIRALELNFYIESPTLIRFGLANVGGIGETTATKFMEFAREKEKDHGPIATWPWYTFLCLCGPEIGRTTILNWISVGAFNHLGISRRLMTQEFTQFKDLFKTAEGEREWISNNWQNYSCFIDLLTAIAKPKKMGGGVSSKKRIPVIESIRDILISPMSSMTDDPVEIAVTEENLLGVAISCSKSDGKPGERWNITCKEFMDGCTQPYMVFKVQVDEVHEHTMTRGREENIGRTMAFLKVSDSTCKLDNVTIFADQYEGNEEEGVPSLKSLLTVGRVLEIRAEPGKKGGLIVQDIWEI